MLAAFRFPLLHPSLACRTASLQVCGAYTLRSRISAVCTGKARASIILRVLSGNRRILRYLTHHGAQTIIKPRSHDRTEKKVCIIADLSPHGCEATPNKRGAGFLISYFFLVSFVSAGFSSFFTSFLPESFTSIAVAFIWYLIVTFDPTFKSPVVFVSLSMAI